ncbi:PQQ-dependent sugar dehydrogenase [Pelagicoccus mobilis]|uniref:PQQ-dependent sugar dehydrogenase n=1 Tax=Pelagicoccus mobilis TaxID=415221 RepID=A0A934S459_9BACT|nr:PQQ-dependent sugar dehydrogenase [Pelagicoccus mobilis]MBK1879447.1 PQQ-dependent sugar dehydrogenase [Pelagicoccus mobilis]
MRHCLLPAAVSLLILSLASSLFAQRVANDTLDFPSSFSTGDYEFEEILNVTAILAIATPPGDTQNVYLAERAGRISIANDLENGTTTNALFLDITSKVTTNLENGLLGLAFHPQYETNGFFYVFYTTQESGQPTNRLSRFTRSTQNPLLADPNSEFILFDQHDEAANHNGGSLSFGLDGYLYVGVGDEGGGGDNFQNGQRIDRDLFAGLLRIDVDKRPGNFEPTLHPAIPRDNQNLAPFSIPADNPLVSAWQEAGAELDSDLRLEFYAIGLRNPWHMDIDPLTGEIWVSDVGEDSYEEINLIQKGGNYGWPNREGSHPFEHNRTVPPEFGPLLDPVYEYGRDQGPSVSGGIVYRGAGLPELYGAYIFSDFYHNHTWALRWSEESSDYEATRIGTLASVSAYGRDPRNGELLAGNIWGGLGTLVRSDSSNAPDFPQTLSETGAFSDLANLTPEAGIYTYEPQMPFWSDHAIKSRWVSIPGSEQVAYSQDDPWTFPEGSVWVKHFELESERGNPASRKRIETRFLVKTETGVYGLSYQWNDDETEASLVPEEGVSIDFPITENGQQSTQTWQVPSRQQCLGCHTPAAGFALSFNTRQLNRIGQHDGQSENTLEYFSRLGVLDTQISDTSNLPRHHLPGDDSVSLETRARSYLAVNCVSCHQPNGGTTSSWDARAHLTLEATGLLDGEAANNGGDTNKRLVVAGSPENSIVLDRMAARDGFKRMPPFGSNELDEEGINLITQWIARHGVEGLFETWQIEHFSSTQLPEAAPDADPDFDGNSNRLEFLSGTLPLDPQSVWRPNFNRDGNSLTVSFPIAPGRTFTIEKSVDLSTWTDWQVEGNPPQSSDAEANVQGPLTDSDENAFFRVTIDE